jgi:Ca-activated chloride channel homolog
MSEEGAMDTQLLLDHEPVADGGYLVRALLRITGQGPEASNRPPLNLAVVLDRSGSMGGGKLERAKEAASLLVRRLGADDVVSVVAYDGDVHTVAHRTRGAHRQEVLARIAGIDTGGATNLSGGWLRGCELVANGLVDGGVNRVLLLTDGQANVGIVDPTQLTGLARSAARRGVATTTIGFGTDYDERLLRAVAEAGRGCTYYIETPEQAPGVFEAEIEGLMALAAQNVSVKIAPGGSVEHVKVLHQYPSHERGDGALRLELGDLHAFEPKAVLMEFLLKSDVDAEAHVAIVKVKGYALLPDGSVEKRRIKLPIQVSRSGAAVVNAEVRKELVLLEAARAREEALEDRTRGAYAEGARRLRRVADKMEPHAAGDAAVQDEMEDLRDLAGRFEAEEVSAADEKWLYQRAYSASRSRRASMESARAARELDRRKRGEP